MENDNKLNFQLWAESQKVKIKQWQKLKNRKKFIGERNYIHFDGKVIFRYHIDSNDHKLTAVLKSSKLIAEHKFLPFVRDDIRVRRYRDREMLTKGGKQRSHDERYPIVKNRPIMYASHRDACIYSMYGFILSERYEKILVDKQLSNNVVAYRRIPISGSGRNKSNIDFANDAFKQVLKNNEVGLLMIDVSHFFDGLNHNLLLKRWQTVMGWRELPKDHKVVFNTLTKYSYVFKKEVYSRLGIDDKKMKELSAKRHGVICSPREFNAIIKKEGFIHKNKSKVGIAQGSPISGLLANLYMIDFDTKMKDFVETQNGGAYQRYSDDILVAIRKDKMSEAYQLAKSLIEDENLKIKDEKTEAFVYEKGKNKYTNAASIIGVSEDLNQKEYPQYLGFTFGKDGLIIRSSTLTRRFRGKWKLDKERWKYFQLARDKTGSSHLEKQVSKVRRKIKFLMNNDEIHGKNANLRKKKRKT